jgi:hypothetical protein
MKKINLLVVCLTWSIFGVILVSCGSLPQGSKPAQASAVQLPTATASQKEIEPSLAPPTPAGDDQGTTLDGPDSANQVDPPTAAPTSLLAPTTRITTPGLAPSAAPKKTSTNTPDPRKLPKFWAEWPLVPVVSTRAREIYIAGLAMGNDPHSFSTIGDCQSVPTIFMGKYDTDKYVLRKGYEYLDKTIQQFRGSFNRDSISVKDGMSVASVLSPMWADPKQCQQGETPLDCELRLHKPSIMFINLGTNWNGGNEVTHEKYLRQIVDILIAHGVVPIISSKGDNQEGGQRINKSMAKVAYDYDIPFWNFWLSIRDLPGKGLDGTREGGYLTPEAWGPRSLTGLMALDAVWREVSK